MNIGKEAARITHYYDKAHLVEREGVTPEEGLAMLEKHIYNPEVIVCGHNYIGFDLLILGLYRKLLGKKVDYSYINRVLDTSLMFKAWKIGATIPKFGTDDFTLFQYQLYNTPMRGIKSSVPTCCKEFGIFYDVNTAHQAGQDVEWGRQIKNELLWKIKI